MKIIKTMGILTLLGASLFAQPAVNEQKLANSGGDTVSMDKEWSIVGDISNETVHTFKLDYSNFQWVEQQHVTALKQGNYGASVAVNGDKMVVGAPDVETWRMEANTITIPETHTNPVFTTITLQRTYEQPPLIFALASSEGDQPSAVKIKNRTNNSFEIVHAEPAPQDGTHNAMTISYFAIERGDHVLPDGTRIFAGEISTKLTRYKNSLTNPGDVKGWETISFAIPFLAQPMALAQIQTMNNEVNNVPSTYSDPWLTAAIQNVGTDSVDLSLERSEVLTSTAVTQDETIAYLVMDVATGSFDDVGNNSIDFESIYTGETIGGWDNGCFATNFTQTFTVTPLVIATKDTLIGGDGGWLRNCSLTSLAIGLTVDEDQYTDSERSHTTERAGILALSAPFEATFKQGEAYLYQYNTATTDWELKESIEPTIFSDNMKFGTSVGIHTNNDGTAQIVVGAPDATTSGIHTGRAFVYNWDGSVLTPGTPLEGETNLAEKFGSSLDIKGDRLVIGAADENSRGAAYTYKYNGTTWDDYPSAGTNKITRIDTNGLDYVAIEDDTLLLSMKDTLSQDEVYIYDASSGSWVEKNSGSVLVAPAVDIDDGVELFIDTAIFNPDIHLLTDYGTTSLLDIDGAGIGSMDSAWLYREQLIVSDPNSNDAVTFEVPCGIKPTHLKTNEWTIISLPCDTTAEINDMFGPDLGAYETNWVMYKQDSTIVPAGKTSTPKVKMASDETMQAGISYWIIADSDKSLFVDDNNQVMVSHTTAPTTRASSSVVWSDNMAFPADAEDKSKIMIGNPYPREVIWGDVYYISDTESDYLVNATEVNQIAYVYNPTSTSGQPYDAVTTAGTPGALKTFKPYQGFFIRMEDNATDPSFSFPFEK